MRSFTFETRKKLYFAPQPYTKMPPADPNNAVAAPDRPPALLVRTRVPVFTPTETESAACAKEKAFCEKHKTPCSDKITIIPVKTELDCKIAGNIIP